MAHPITIIGGNIAGLSAAWHLSRKGCPVTVYEAKLWDKPCGGAISIGFARYLSCNLDIGVPALNQNIPKVRCCFSNFRCVETDPLFVIISRRYLQEQLVTKLAKEPNITFIFEPISARNLGLLSPQTILATGFSGFTRHVIQGQWYSREYARVLKSQGIFQSPPTKPAHLLFFDSRLKGYGWMFIENDHRFNCGISGLIDKKNLLWHYEVFISRLIKKLGYPIHPESPPIMWKIPIMTDHTRTPVSFFKHGIEFIGAGDALGLAHPVIAAGIEPAWQSGWLIGESYDPRSGLIHSERYRNLLNKNLGTTSRSRFNTLASRMLRVPWLPLKDTLSFGVMKFFNRPIIRHILKNPWFAAVHDGHTRTELKEYNDELSRDNNISHKRGIRDRIR